MGTTTDGRIVRWDTATGRVVRDLAAVEMRTENAEAESSLHSRYPLDASPNGFFLVTGSASGAIRMWDATLAGPPRDHAVSVSATGGHASAVSAVAFAWDGS